MENPKKQVQVEATKKVYFTPSVVVISVENSETNQIGVMSDNSDHVGES